MKSSRKAGNLEEGLRNTEIKRETDIRNSLGPQDGSERGRSSSDSSESMVRDSDAYGRETPDLPEDRE